MKRILSLLLTLAMALSLLPAAFAAGSGTAYPSTQTVTVDGKPIEFQMYALKDAKGNDTNYIKLRDLAYVLSGSRVSFDVDYQEATGIIEIWADVPYYSNGTEMKTPFSGSRSYTAKSVTIQYDYFWGKTLDAIVLTDDNGGDYTYFKLRDLGDLLGFKVEWSAAKGVTIDTGSAEAMQKAVQVQEKAAEVVRLVNEERAKAGVAPVSTYETLDKAAQIRATELIAYYDHTRPNGSSFSTVLGEVGITYITAGENIANGTMAQNPSGVMAIWMNSPGHRANIMNPKFTHVGVGCVYEPSDPYRFYWVQVFAGEDGASSGTMSTISSNGPTEQNPVPGRVYTTNPLIKLGVQELSGYTVHEPGLVTVWVDDAWTAAHGESYNIVWSTDVPTVLHLEPGDPKGDFKKTVFFEFYASGEAKITCTVTGEDGYTAEAYCYVYTD